MVAVVVARRWCGCHAHCGGLVCQNSTVTALKIICLLWFSLATSRTCVMIMQNQGLDTYHQKVLSDSDCFDKGTIHIGHRHFLGRDGSKIGQICQRRVVKDCWREWGRDQKALTFANFLNERSQNWSTDWLMFRRSLTINLLFVCFHLLRKVPQNFVDLLSRLLFWFENRLYYILFCKIFSYSWFTFRFWCHWKKKKWNIVSS